MNASNIISIPGTKLGKDQRAILETLVKKSGRTWTPCCGWVWKNSSTTARLLDSLVKRGLVEKYDYTVMAGSAKLSRSGWRATEAGVNLALGMSEAQYQEQQDTLRRERERVEAERRAAFEASERRFAEALPRAFLAVRLALEAGHAPGTDLVQAAVNYGANMDRPPSKADVARVLGMTVGGIARMWPKKCLNCACKHSH
jgi:hypothetical protein